MQVFVVLANTGYDTGECLRMSVAPVAVTKDEQTAKEIADLLDRKYQQEVADFESEKSDFQPVDSLWHTVAESRLIESLSDFAGGR